MTIKQLPLEILLENMRRQKNRFVLDIMQELWERIELIGEFTLSDGKKCKVKQFSPPYEREGEARFGFDVQIKECGIDHIEFLVKSSGFGGMTMPVINNKEQKD